VFQILLAEDNPGDVLLLREALKSRCLACNLVVAEDGQKAITLLDQAGQGQTSFQPNLIVLDINLPKHNGDAVLRYIRRQSLFSRVPVIVLTSSPSPTDRAAALELGANLYLQKSSDLKQLLDMGRIIESMLFESTNTAAG
jgi:two-component system, chemotaxis family, response regulator Rcp1